jgi:hypothetical protein
MDRATFIERVEREIMGDHQVADYAEVFSLLVHGEALAELKKEAHRREDNFTITYHGEANYWEGNLGSSSATGPDFLGVADLILDDGGYDAWLQSLGGGIE